jgi:SAM-dependent methyltransferase
VVTSADRLIAAVRRFVDLQAGSIWKDLSRLIPDYKGSILDVGCGAQPYRSLVSPRANYRGIDDAGAERHFGYCVPDTTYFEGGRWPVADASADVILSTETLEHVPEPEVFLGEAIRCLKPGGHLLLTVPFAARWHFIPHDYWRFTPSGIRCLLDRAGFTEIVVFSRGNALTVACYKVMALILPLLLPQRRGGAIRFLSRAAGLVMLPLLFFLALVGNLSLKAPGGDDCLGYTVIAMRSDRAESFQRSDARTNP